MRDTRTVFQKPSLQKDRNPHLYKYLSCLVGYQHSPLILMNSNSNSCYSGKKLIVWL